MMENKSRALEVAIRAAQEAGKILTACRFAYYQGYTSIKKFRDLHRARNKSKGHSAQCTKYRATEA